MYLVWDFEKNIDYLVDKDGTVLDQFDSDDNPLDPVSLLGEYGYKIDRLNSPRVPKEITDHFGKGIRLYDLRAEKKCT